jgi:hypothetical protein
VLILFYSHLNVKLIRPEINYVPSEAGVVERIINKDFNIKKKESTARIEHKSYVNFK